MVIHTGAGIPDHQLVNTIHRNSADLYKATSLWGMLRGFERVHHQFANHHRLRTALYEARDEKVFVNNLQCGNGARGHVILSELEPAAGFAARRFKSSFHACDSVLQSTDDLAHLGILKI